MSALSNWENTLGIAGAVCGVGVCVVSSLYACLGGFGTNCLFSGGVIVS